MIKDYEIFPARERWYTDQNGKQRSHIGQVVHFFGEMDLPLTASFEVAAAVANHIAECCGYSATWRSSEGIITVRGDNEVHRAVYGPDGMIDAYDYTAEWYLKQYREELNAQIILRERAIAAINLCEERIAEYEQRLRSFPS